MNISGATTSTFAPFGTQFEQAMADALGMSDASGVTVQFTDTVDGVQITWTFDSSYANVVSQNTFQSNLLTNLKSYEEVASVLGDVVTSTRTNVF